VTTHRGMATLTRANPGAAPETVTPEQPRAACEDHPDRDEIFYPRKGESYDRARSLCRRCPVRDACLALAMDAEGGVNAPSRFGMFGGLSPVQRAELARAS